MVFTHNKNADQFDPLSYGNVRVLETNSQPPSFTEMSSGDAALNSNVTGKHLTCERQKSILLYGFSLLSVVRSWKGEHV